MGRIGESDGFRRSDKLRAFLEYIVERKLAGAADDISEYLIATEVYGRPKRFDPATDNIVRVEAGRLRRRLDEFYEAHAAGDVRILLPPRTYVPEFEPLRFRSLPNWLQERLNRLRGEHVRAALVGLLVVLGLIAFVYAFIIDRRGDERLLGLVDALDNRTTGLEGENVSQDAPLELAAGLLPTEQLAIIQLHKQRGGQDGSEVEDGPLVDYIVDGRVDASDSGDLRVTLQLRRTENDQLLWTEYFVGNPEEVLQQVRRAADSLRIALTAEIGRFPRPPTRNLEAYQAFLGGQALAREFNIHRRQADLLEAKRLLELAVQLEPKLVLALIERALLELNSLYPPPLARERPQILQEANAALNRAFELDADNATALVLRGWIELEEGDPIEGAILVQKALRIEPDNPLIARVASIVYEALGYYEKARELQRKRRQAPSEPPTSLHHEALLTAYIGDGAEAAILADTLQRVYPTICLFAITQAEISLWSRDFDGARQHALTYSACIGGLEPADMGTAGVIAAAELAGGNRTEGLALIEKWADRSPAAMDSFLIALAYSGQVERATEAIRSHPFYSNYRWLVSAPLPGDFLATASARSLSRDLYLEWQRGLEQIGGEISYPPPALSPPSD